MHAKKHTAKEKVYNVLLLHEFMKTSTISEKVGLSKSTISGALTSLRREGLAEYSGKFGSDLRWKKYPINNPMYPSQPDLLNRKNRNANIKPKVTTEIHLERVNELLLELAEEFAILKKQCKDSVFVEHGEIGGVKIYRKSK